MTPDAGCGCRRWHGAGVGGTARHSMAGQHKDSTVLFHLRHSSCLGNKAPQWDKTSGCRGESHVLAGQCVGRVARCGRRDAGTHRHLIPLPSRRYFFGPGRWPGWRSSGTRRPAGTSPFSRRRAGASWHGSSSRRGRFVPATLPSPLLRRTISPKMGSAAFLPPPGPAPPPPASPPRLPSRGGPGRTGGPGGNRQGGCWASPWRDEATYCLLLLLLKRA